MLAVVVVGTPIPDVVKSVVVGVCTVVAGAVPVMVVMPVSVLRTAREEAETALAERVPPAARAAEYAEEAAAADEGRVVAAALAAEDAVPAAARRAEEAEAAEACAALLRVAAAVSVAGVAGTVATGTTTACGAPDSEVCAGWAAAEPATLLATAASLETADAAFEAASSPPAVVAALANRAVVVGGWMFTGAMVTGPVGMDAEAGSCIWVWKPLMVRGMIGPRSWVLGEAMPTEEGSWEGSCVRSSTGPVIVKTEVAMRIEVTVTAGTVTVTVTAAEMSDGIRGRVVAMRPSRDVERNGIVDY